MIGGATLGAVTAGVVTADAEGWDLWQQPWMLDVLQIPVIGAAPRAVTTAVVLGVGLLLALPVRRVLFGRPLRGPAGLLWLALALGAAALGAVAGVVTILVVDVWLKQIPMGLPDGGRAWVVAASAVGGLAFLNLALAQWWRKVVAVLALVPVVGAMLVGINASYGILQNVGQLLGKPAAEIVDVGELPQHGGAAPGVAWLAREWRPPADMPEVGRRLTLPIPATVSGFPARPASIYLPPAALVPDAPPLPVVVLMMGQPGVPDVTYVADALDDRVAAHRGLAPIVVVADQTGSPWNDTLCMDTDRRGRAETYINTDVVDFIRGHLRVSHDPTDWVVAGYSNGGLCAGRFFARHPDVWGNALDIAGEEFPGSDHPAQHLKEFFGGDPARYEAERLPVVLGERRHDGGWFVATVTSDDPSHRDGARRVAAAAAASGAHTRYLEFPEGGHGVDTVIQGLEGGLDVLYPTLGLDEQVSPAQADAAPQPPIPPAPPAGRMVP